MTRITLPLTIEAMALIDMAVRESASRAERDVAICRKLEGERASQPDSEGYMAGQRHATLVSLTGLLSRPDSQMYLSFEIGDDELFEPLPLAVRL